MKSTSYKGHTIVVNDDGNYEVITMKGTQTPHPILSQLRLAKSHIDRTLEQQEFNRRTGQSKR